MKKISILLCMIGFSFLFTGCLKRDTMEDITIYTSVYPIEYITNRLYGEHSTIHSIYPDGIIPEQYDLTDKQISDYSKSGLFIFNGLSNEKNYIEPMLKSNRNLKIIDASTSVEYSNGLEELWLDPSNFLMLTQNIKNGFHEYINNHYLKNNIDSNYEQLKLEISNIDARLKLMAENTDNKVIVVGNDVFKFLSKYNLTVHSLQENENLTDKMVASVKTLIEQDKISYIFLKEHEEANETIKNLIAGTNVQLVELRTISNITEQERTSKKDYISLMNENIELLKNELYD